MKFIPFIKSKVVDFIYASPFALLYLKIRYKDAWRIKTDFCDYLHVDRSGERQRLLARLLTYAKKHVPYYQRLLSSVTITPEMAEDVLKTLPLLSKDIIRRENTNIYSDDLKHCVSHWQNTGGSTGEPLYFPVSLAPGFENELAFYLMMGWKLHDKIISFDGTHIPEERIQKGIFYTIKTDNHELPYGRVRFSALYFEEQHLPPIIHQLEEQSPQFLRGYSSAFIILGHYLLKHNISLSFQLKGLYFTSEVCPSDELETIRLAFKCPVFGQYGNSECTHFGLASDGMTYICSPEHGYVEVVDEEGHQVAEGECGEVVSTGLHSFAMPFIRYKTGDLAEYGGTINGFVILKSLLGRTIDYVLNSENRKIYLVGFIFGSHLKAFNHIASWQLEQNTPGKLEMRIVRGDGFNKIDEDEIIAHFASVKVSTSINYVKSITRTPRCKQKFIIQNCR